MIPQSFVDELLERVDIASLIESSVPLKRAGNEFKACCPFHNEKTPSFYVVPDKRIYHCFGCGKSGNALGWVMDYDGLGFVDAVKQLAGELGLEVPDDRQSAAYRRNSRPKDDLYDVHTRLTEWYRANLHAPIGQQAREYLHQRGVSPEMQERFQLGYAPNEFQAVSQWGKAHKFSQQVLLRAGVLTQKEEGGRPYDRWRHRLMFPIIDERQRVVGFSGRLLDQDAKGGKYVNSPETDIFKKGRILYGIGQARDGIRKHGASMLCEGQLDVIALHQAGWDNAVAPQGTAFTEDQAKLLARFAPELLLAFDSDRAGMEAAVKAVGSYLPAGLSARVIRLGEGEDPDSLIKQHGPAGFTQRLEQAVDYFDFLLDYHCTQHNPQDPQGKQQIAVAYLEIVRQLPSEILRSEYIKRLSARLAVAEDVLGHEMHSQQDAAEEQQRRQVQRRLQQASTPPADPALERLATEESVLLDIALHHSIYAGRMLRELEASQLPATAAGCALRNLLGRTAMAEWSAGVRDMARFANDQGPVARLLIRPDYPLNVDERKLRDAYQGCIHRLKLAAINQEMARPDCSAERQQELHKQRASLEQAHRKRR